MNFEFAKKHDLVIVSKKECVYFETIISILKLFEVQIWYQFLMLNLNLNL